VNYAKLDPALISALEDAAPNEQSPMAVFVRFKCPPSTAESEALSRLGIRWDPAASVLTANVPPRSIEELSEQSCVSYVELAQRLNLLDGRR